MIYYNTNFKCYKFINLLYVLSTKSNINKTAVKMPTIQDESINDRSNG